MKGLLIAEKPSLMKAIKEVYDKTGCVSDNLDFDCFRGHYMELVQPEAYDAKYQKWNKEDLPILPDPFQYQPTKQNRASVKSLNDKIKSGGYDYVINACDAAREGELIFWSFYKTYGHKLPVKRLWISDTTDTTIKKGLQNLIPENEPSIIKLQEAARLRAEMDWLYGMNFSRALSIASGTTIAAGRVMTPTLKMIVDKEIEIKNFKPESYFEIWAEHETSGNKFNSIRLAPPNYESGKIESKKEADDIISVLTKMKEVKVRKINEKTETTHAPTLHSLLELQKEANKTYGYTATKTLEIAQKLYDDKLLTYPRTESRHLAKAMVPDIPNHLRVIKNIPELLPFLKKIDKKRIDDVLKGKRYVDDAKVTDHHAILVTTKEADYNKLSKDEQNIYLLVAKRFISIFLDPYIVNKTDMFFSYGKEFFKANGKVEKQKGFSVLYKSNTKDVILPNVKVGDMVPVNKVESYSKKTKPPARCNDSSILNDMQNAGKKLELEEQRKVLRESAGLGTSATRAAILEKLEKRKWISRKGKNMFATEEGIKVIETIGDREITSPALTATWEKKLKEIEDMKYQNNFNLEMRDYVKKEVDKIFSEVKFVGKTGMISKTIGKCPECGNDVVEGKSYYFCKEYKKTCKMIVPKEFMKTKFKEKDMKVLLEGKATDVKNIEFNSGKKGKKSFVLEDGRLSFAEGKKDGNPVGKCPKCKDDFIETENSYFCFSPDCNTSFPKSFMGHRITAEEAIKLSKGETITIFRDGKKDGEQANIYYDGEKIQFVREKISEDEKENMIVVGKCPKCGSKVLSAKDFYLCTGYPKECDFSTKKTIREANVTEEDMKAMLSGKTSEPKVFRWKSGKKSKAKMFFDGTTGALKFEF